MKKILLSTLAVMALSTSVFGASKCVKIVTTQPSNMVKELDGQFYYGNYSKVSYDENKKIKINSFNDMYGDFYLYLIEELNKKCEKDGFTSAYDMKISYVVDENKFYFQGSATIGKE